MDSIEQKQSTYEDLKKAQHFLGELTDLLYGEQQEIPEQKQFV